MAELKLISRKLMLLLTFLVISLVTMYLYILLNTIDLNAEDIAKDIVKRGASTVEIIQVTESRGEQFILFSNTDTGQLGMIYYKPHPIVTNRYEFLGGSNIGGFADLDLDQNYYVYGFEQVSEKGHDNLFVVYGRTEPYAKTLEIDFGDQDIITRNIEGKNYFLEVVRFSEERFSIPKVRFRDVDWESRYKVIDKVKFHVLINEYLDNNDKLNPEITLLVREYWCFDGTGEINQVYPVTYKIALDKSNELKSALDFKNHLKKLNSTSSGLELMKNTIISDAVSDLWAEEGYVPELEYSKESPKGLSYEMLEQ